MGDWSAAVGLELSRRFRARHEGPHPSQRKARMGHPATESECRGLPGNPIDNGVVFRICAAFDDLAVEPFGYAPAGRVLPRYRVNEPFLAQVFLPPIGERSHDFPTKAPAVRALL